MQPIVQATTKPTNQITYEFLLNQALTEPGILSQAYRLFHDYSYGNTLMAVTQMYQQNLQIGPIATYKKWTQLGRQVKKGSKAIGMYIPISFGKDNTDKETQTNTNQKDEKQFFTKFLWKNNWFTLSQTDGEPVSTELPNPKAWNKDKALQQLEIQEIPFTHLDGNCQGYATKRSVAINPVAEEPTKTLFHELGHILLGHTEKSSPLHDTTLPKNIKEVEAESVAYITSAALGITNLESSRGYIQHWLKDQTINEKSAQKIFKTVNQILTAGKE